MSRLTEVNKIEAFLNGFAAPGVTPAAPSRGFGAKKAPPPPPPVQKQLQRRAPGPTQVSIPFYEGSRRYQPDADDVFKKEKAAARRDRPEFGPEPTGYTFPHASPISEDTGMTQLNKVAANKNHAARILFIDWLKTDQPEVYAEVVGKLQAEGMGETAQPTLWEKIIGSLSTVVATVAGAKAQKKILEMNLTRAEQGLPPVDAATMAPVVRTEVAVTPEMAADLRAGANKALLYGGIGAAALVLVMMLGKRRR